MLMGKATFLTGHIMHQISRKYKINSFDERERERERGEEI